MFESTGYKKHKFFSSFFMTDELKVIEIGKIRPNPHQPRRQFNGNEIEELAASIRSVGLLHPPLVRKVPNSCDFELVSGERRLRAAKLASLTHIPVYVRAVDDSLSAEAALIENIQRVDLCPLDIAKALRQHAEKYALTQDQLAEKMGKKRSTVANYLRLLTLPAPIQESLRREAITMGHAKAILSVEGERKQTLLHAHIVQGSLSVRDAEKKAAEMNAKTTFSFKDTKKNRNIHIEALEKRLRERLGTAVRIYPRSLSAGSITIDYTDLEDLERVLALIGGEV